jgi:hypothetical protein
MSEIQWEITKWDSSVLNGLDNLPNEVFVAKEDVNSSSRPKQMKLLVYGKEYAINLENGTFLKDGVWMEHPQPLPSVPQNFRLIYFKRVRKLIAEIPIMWPDGSGGFQEIATTKNIHLGFQCTSNGQNYKRVMVILPNGDVSWTSD